MTQHQANGSVKHGGGSFRREKDSVIENQAQTVTDSVSQKAATRAPAAGTRERLLRAGAKMFAEQGFHAVSVRGIVAEADVNLGAINYHFGSKQALFEEIFAIGATRMIKLRLELLDECREGPGRPPLLEQVVTAYLAPGLVYAGSDPDIVQFQRIRARIITEDSTLAHQLLRRHYQESTRRFLDAFARALPDVPRPLLLWRYQTMIATVVYGGSSWGTVQSAPDEDKPADESTALDNLVPLIAAMFRTRTEDQPVDAVGILSMLQKG